MKKIMLPSLIAIVAISVICIFLIDNSNSNTFILTPPTGEGFIFTRLGAAGNEIKKGENFKFTITIKDTYTGIPIINVDGSVLDHDNNIYTILNVTSNKTITISGLSLKPVEEEEIFIPEGPYVDVKRDFAVIGDNNTSDAEKIIAAFITAQDEDIPLYFPEGIYNLNNLDFNTTANANKNKDIKIYGASMGKTELLNPGRINVFTNITIKNLKINKNANSRIFIYFYLEDAQIPARLIDIDIDSVEFVCSYSTAITSETYNSGACRFLYLVSSDKDRGVNNLRFVNNKISGVRFGLLLNCTIKSGYVAKNIMSEIGNEDFFVESAGAFRFGGGEICKASNLQIEENVFKNINSAPWLEKLDKEIHGVICYGEDITIKNNYFENITGGMDAEAVYGKVRNYNILNNTFVNAGEGEGSLCIKFNGGVSKVIGNTFTNSNTNMRPGSGAILTLCVPNFIVEDNKIISAATDEAAIYIYNFVLKSGVIKNNDIYTEGRATIFLSYADNEENVLDGSIEITENKLTQNNLNYDAVKGTGYANINIASASPSSSVCINNNLIDSKAGTRAIYIRSGYKNQIISSGCFASISGNNILSSEARSFGAIQFVNGVYGVIEYNQITLLDAGYLEGTAYTSYGMIYINQTTAKTSINNNKLIYKGRTCTRLIYSTTNNLNICDNEIELYNTTEAAKLTLGQIAYFYSAIENVNTQSNAAKINNNICTVYDGVILNYLITINNLSQDGTTVNQPGYFIIENNTFNIQNQMIRVSASTGGTLITQSITISNNNITTSVVTKWITSGFEEALRII